MSSVVPDRASARGASPARPVAESPAIDYALSTTITATLKEWLAEALDASDVRRICELGAGAHPLAPLRRIARTGVDYVVVDVDPAQLGRVPRGYQTELVNVASPMAGDLGRFDLILSRYVLEHVVDPVGFHTGVGRLLARGGRAIHLFSTLYSPPFVMNRLLPEAVSTRLLRKLQPHRAKPTRTEKFPAYYRWCRGPTAGQIRRLESAGFTVERYRGFFGHSGSAAEGGGYLDRWPRLAERHAQWARWLAAHPTPWLTSHALVSLAKRAD